MSLDNQGRFLRALIDKVVVDEDKGTCRVELIDFGAAAGTRDAALPRTARSRIAATGDYRIIEEKVFWQAVVCVGFGEGRSKKPPSSGATAGEE